MAKLEAQVDYLKRKLWGKMSEKRQLPEDPRQLKINFEGLEFTDKEKRELQEAEEHIRKERKTIRVKEHVKQHPVRHKLPDTLCRVETHLYPEGYEGHEDEWVLFGDTETSEQLEVTAPDMWVSVMIRHKVMRKSDKKVMTAACPLVPYPKVLPKSPIGKALHYLLTRIKQLSGYIKDGRYAIDNNPIENCVRPLAIGRKNYMFCGNHNAAEEAAIMYTMMGCKLADVDFRKWTTYFLQNIHEYDDDYSKDLTDFFPHILKEKGLV